MKLTNKRLKQIIKEEIVRLMEQDLAVPAGSGPKFPLGAEGVTFNFGGKYSYVFDQAALSKTEKTKILHFTVAKGASGVGKTFKVPEGHKLEKAILDTYGPDYGLAGMTGKGATPGAKPDAGKGDQKAKQDKMIAQAKKSYELAKYDPELRNPVLAKQMNQAYQSLFLLQRNKLSGPKRLELEKLMAHFDEQGTCLGPDCADGVWQKNYRIAFEAVLHRFSSDAGIHGEPMPDRPVFDPDKALEKEKIS